MANKLPAVKGSEYTFGIVLFAQSDDQIKTTPTIASGDFQVSTDGGSFGNLSTTPSESPASSGRVLVTLSTSEMNGDEVMVRWIDASGDEWHSGAVTIFTSGQTFDTIDGNVDSVLDDTGTSGVVLADDAITSAKFDESTAFPLASADTGSTAVARTGADSDTLETLSDQLDATATASALATVDSNVDAILADTGTDGVVVASINANAVNAAAIAANAIDADALAADAIAEINATVDTAISDAALATAAALATVDANVDSILEDTGTTIPAQISGLNDPDASTVASAVWSALSDTEKNAIADAVLSRGVDNVEDTAGALTLAELVLAAFESAISSTTWTIYKSDHSTTFNTRTVTVDADADPITEVT